MTEDRPPDRARPPPRCHDGRVHLRKLLAARPMLAALVVTVLLTVPVTLAVPAGSVAATSAAALPDSPAPATGDTVPGGDTSDGSGADTGTDTGENGYADNPFLPEDRTLGECSSSLPKPGCGSSAHGGWRQGIVFAVLMLGMAFIGWRIFRAVRRADRRVPG